MTLPIADWQAALDGMETALLNTLASLDRYQATWSAVLSSPAPRALLPVGDADRAEDRLRAWDERLGAAAELAESVSQQLDDREAAVGRWRELFADWQRVIQRAI
ncbi:MAG TPA: hypothetical protein VMZ71_16430 [Gemmataceae bacterium]|nr:hypothetical protein [Gemmataceae bacterium]